jgi:hypothetical protein
MDNAVSNRGSGPVQSDLNAVNDMDIDMDIDFMIDPEIEVMEGDMVPTVRSRPHRIQPVCKIVAEMKNYSGYFDSKWRCASNKCDKSL